ncbi:hypothetical protein IT408_03225 [Candidatus Uhrbacteria bacterium]|nr:hypothetical protein [Candidatus Uhrbacteria bacterium]
MIDSVTIQTDQFVTYSDEFFTKAQHQDLKGEFGIFGRYTSRYTTYPQTCKAEGRYFPQVHIVERLRRGKAGMVPVKRSLMIQVSLPKLVFGTSIFDLDERLLPLAAQKLADALKEIKISVASEHLLNAIVTRVDYSKILKISPTYGTTDRILRALAPYEMKQSSDFNRRDYHDGRDGFYVKFFNSSQGFVIYDKFDEIVANGKTKLEQEIARQYKDGKWTRGALRVELSLQKKQTVEMVLQRYSDSSVDKKTKDFTLRDVAKTHIAKDCLLRVFDSVYVKDFNRLVRLADLKDAELLRIINEEVNDFRDRAIFYYLAHRVRAQGLKRAIEEMKREASSATVGRYKRAIESILSRAEAKKNVVGVVPYLRRKLEDFTPVLPKKLGLLLGVGEDTLNM